MSRLKGTLNRVGVTIPGLLILQQSSRHTPCAVTVGSLAQRTEKLYSRRVAYAAEVGRNMDDARADWQLRLWHMQTAVLSGSRSRQTSGGLPLATLARILANSAMAHEVCPYLT